MQVRVQVRVLRKQVQVRVRVRQNWTRVRTRVQVRTRVLQVCALLITDNSHSKSTTRSGGERFDMLHQGGIKNFWMVKALIQ